MTSLLTREPTTCLLVVLASDCFVFSHPAKAHVHVGTWAFANLGDLHWRVDNAPCMPSLQ